MFIAKSDLSIQREHVRQRQPALYAWYCELDKLLSACRSGCNQFNIDWTLIGQGLLIEGADKEAFLHFLKWVSDTKGIRLIQIKKGDLYSLISQISNN